MCLIVVSLYCDKIGINTEYTGGKEGLCEMFNVRSIPTPYVKPVIIHVCVR